MPFSGNTYEPVAGAITAAPGQVLQSAIWDAINTDYAAAFTLLMTQLNTTPTWANILAPNGGAATETGGKFESEVNRAAKKPYHAVLN